MEGNIKCIFFVLSEKNLNISDWPKKSVIDLLLFCHYWKILTINGRFRCISYQIEESGKSISVFEQFYF
jgi:hypothetical protein